MLAMVQLPIRPRRNRTSKSVRALVRETEITPSDLIWPLFVVEGSGERKPVSSMPGCFRLSRDQLVEEARAAFDLDIPAVALFPVIEDGKKDSMARESVNPDGLLQRTIRDLEEKVPDLCVITDVAMDPYSSDGHDGILKDGVILNDETLDVLAAMAVSQAEAGADMVAPSDMMDGRVGFIREALDDHGFEQVSILSYAAKYASAFYGPFREALDSAPRGGDKKSYQMDPANVREALREVFLDVAEGADIVMVKPAMPYLDVIAAVRANVEVPVAAYQVSGEYAMIKSAGELGRLDADAAMREALLSIKRAGADMIFTYAAREVAESLSG